MMAAELDTTALLTALHINPKKFDEITKNAALVTTLREVIAESGLNDPSTWTKTFTSNVYEVATRFPKPSIQHRPFFMTYVAQDKISKSQLNPCFGFFKKHGFDQTVSKEEFESECGIGAEITRDDVVAVVDKILAAFSDAESAWGAYPRNMAEAKATLKFADAKVVKEVLDSATEAKFGAKVHGSKKAPAKETSKTSTSTSTVKDELVADKDDNVLHVKFHHPTENYQVDPELLKKHLAETDSKVRTRFPPEPNGYLHLGHCKAMNLNFGYAAREGGVCYLRFDDTNPEAEEQEYIDGIINAVEWMGFKPWKVTYTSDYFQELFDFAVQLIKEDKAFVCHQTKDEMQRDRKAGIPSPWRNRPTEESLALFYEMRDGKHEEGSITLRLKMDMSSGNPNMRDFVAYRIKRAHHPRTGDRWIIYPSYDYSHCIVDSLENITHSLCSLEFDSRREPYEWILRALRIYCPRQIEFSRLNVTRHLMSKRRIIKLVKSGILRGWDDPRLATIVGLRRRGFTAEILKDFVTRAGISRNNQVIALSYLETIARDHFNTSAPRALAVIDPIKVTCINFPETEVLDIEVADYPVAPERGSHIIPFSRVFYIDRSDFRLEDSADYYRLTPKKEVGLRYFKPSWAKEGEYYLFKYVSHKSLESDPSRVVELEVEIVTKTSKPKAHYIQFVAEAEPGVTPKEVEFRLYEDLFTVDNPGALLEATWESALNKNSLVIANGYVDTFASGARVYDRFQFERLGYFTVDQDSNDSKLVFTRILPL